MKTRVFGCTDPCVGVISNALGLSHLRVQDRYKHVVSIVFPDAGADQEIKHRCASADRAIQKVSRFLNTSVAVLLKMRIITSMVLSTLLVNAAGMFFHGNQISTLETRY